jgi:DtxR family Mn-dependent transcriptional regulator
MTNTTQHLSPSLEDYLEATFWVTAINGAARARDIAKTMHVRASSVTEALQALARNRYINYKPYEAITLTAEGFDAALEVVQKHKILKDFFIGILGVDETLSEDIACKIEHSIPCDVADKIARFTSLLETISPDLQSRLAKLKKSNIRDSRNKKDTTASRATAHAKDKTRDIPAPYENTVADLKPGKPAVIIRLKSYADVSKQLAHMGLGRGAQIIVERIAPLGDPISVKIRGYRLMLRKKDAANIVVLSR